VKLGGDMEILERAGMLARLDLVIALAGRHGAARRRTGRAFRSSLGQCAARKRLYACGSARASIYLHPTARDAWTRAT
jgi:hypothetical protein